MSNRLCGGVAAVSLTSLQARHGSAQNALQSFRELIGLRRGSDWMHLLVGLLAWWSCSRASARIRRPRCCMAPCWRGTAPPIYGADRERLAAIERAMIERLGADTVAAGRARGAAVADDEVLAFALATIDQALAVARP